MWTVQSDRRVWFLIRCTVWKGGSFVPCCEPVSVFESVRELNKAIGSLLAADQAGKALVVCIWGPQSGAQVVAVIDNNGHSDFYLTEQLIASSAGNLGFVQREMALTTLRMWESEHLNSSSTAKGDVQ